jgi:hypothetical protein
MSIILFSSFVQQHFCFVRYLDSTTGQLISGNYTASINEQWLTAAVPAPSRRCLSAIHSADMAGTPAKSTEVWGGEYQEHNTESRSQNHSI